MFNRDETHLKFRVWNPKYKEFSYWGFIDGHFKGPPTGSGLTIEECSKSDRFMNIQDRDGNDIYENDILNIVFGQDTVVHEKGGYDRHVVLSFHKGIGKLSWESVDGRPGGPWGFSVHRNRRVVKTFKIIGSVQSTPEYIIAGQVSKKLLGEDDDDLYNL